MIIMMTKKKFTRLLTKINISIIAKDRYLPTKVCDEMRKYDMWDIWCDEVNKQGIATSTNRRLAIPHFIKIINDKLVL